MQKNAKKTDRNQFFYIYELNGFYSWLLTNFSASSHAIHPVHADVIAWR
jgi:hypothetical protein